MVKPKFHRGPYIDQLLNGVYYFNNNDIWHNRTMIAGFNFQPYEQYKYESQLLIKFPTTYAGSLSFRS